MRLLIAALAEKSTATVPISDDGTRDGRVVAIALGPLRTAFHEHRAPPFWPNLKRATSLRGG